MLLAEVMQTILPHITAVYYARGKIFTDLSKEEGDYDEPNDIIREGTEGLTESECLGEYCCSD